MEVEPLGLTYRNIPHMPQKRIVFLSIFLILSVIVVAYPLLNEPGQLDSTFGNGGKITTSLGGRSDERILDVAIQADGKIVCVGSRNPDFTVAHSVIVRYNSDGSLDPTFNMTGVLILPLNSSSGDTANSVDIQPDGKIVVSGSTYNGAVTRGDFYVLRLSIDGSLDTTFGASGIAFADFHGLNDLAYAMVIQPDEKILVGGQASPVDSYFNFALARFNPDGSLDLGFGNGGKVDSGTPTIESVIYDVSLSSDGRIVAAGRGHNGTTILRYNPDGSADVTFGTNGMVITDLGGYDAASAVDTQPDGKIVAIISANVGSFSHFVVARYSTDGSLDPSFGEGGIVTTLINIKNAGEDALDGLIQPDGKIVAVGTSRTGTYPIAAVRYDSDGSLDTTFNSTGIVLTSIGNGSHAGQAVALQSDGKILVAGESLDSTTGPDFAAVRYNPNGTLDMTFGSPGMVTTAFDTVSDSGNGVALYSDGKIVAAGRTRGISQIDATAVSRFTMDGKLDTTFSADGKTITSMGPGNDEAFRVAVQNDGKIVVAGYAGNFPNSDFAVARFNANGLLLDSTFGNNGKVLVPIGTAQDIAYDMVIQSDNKIVIAGLALVNSTTDFAVVRLNANGSLDTSFGSNGIITTPVSDGEDVIRSIKLQPDGKIIVAGYVTPIGSSSDFAIARYNIDGSLDPSFGSGGKVITSIGSSDDRANALALQSDGKLVVTGYSVVSAHADFAVIRYNDNGTLDSSFNGNGIVTTTVSPTSADSANDIVIQRNGRIVIGGSTVFDNDSNVALVRYNPDGTPDISFGSGGIVVTNYGNRGEVLNSLALQSDGKIVGVGSIDDRSTRLFMVLRYEGDNVGPTPTPTPTVTPTPIPTPTPTATPTPTPTPSPIPSPAGRTAFDFDGDRMADVSVFRPGDGAWYLLRSTGGFNGVSFGLATDKIAPADFDGDGTTDVAVYRPSQSTWYWLNSSTGTLSAVPFGASEDLPTPADYDGDGRADTSVFRPSNGVWYRLNSSNGSFYAVQFGAGDDKPTIGDYDGDGRADVAVFRPSTGAWYRLNSSNGQFIGISFGFSTDLITPADFDGDAKTDVAVYRPSSGTWFWLNSTNGGLSAVPFGTSEDMPVAADFDGDGRADVSVFRPSNGVWYRLNSGNGSFFAVQFGTSTDRPTPAAFRY